MDLTVLLSPEFVAIARTPGADQRKCAQQDHPLTVILNPLHHAILRHLHYVILSAAKDLSGRSILSRQTPPEEHDRIISTTTDSIYDMTGYYMDPQITCSTKNIGTLQPSQVKAIIASDKEDDYLLVDVREREEYEAGHIPGAKWIPLGELEHRHQELRHNKRIIVYCRSGRRSLAGALLLCGLGFTDLYSMEGGILSWSSETTAGPPEEGIHLFATAKELHDVLLVALQSEYGACILYNKIGEQVQGKTDLFHRLQEIEASHLQIIYDELKKYWTEAPPLEELKRTLAVGHVESGVSADAAFAKFQGTPRDGLEMIEIAIEMEAKAYDLYRRMAEAVGSDELRQLFLRLAAVEKEHTISLSQELQRFM